jgi:predicted nucleic acid-binding protein
MPHDGTLLSARRVFNDSSAYLALLDRRDEHHGEAVSILTALAAGHYRAFTTSTIVIEAHALILANLGGDQARAFLRTTTASRTRLIQVRARDVAVARDLLLRYTDKAWSYTDAISFVVMERLGIRLAFTFDDDFSQYGFTRLTPGLLV